MYNKDKLNSIDVKLSYIKDKMMDKRRLDAEERGKIKEKIAVISETITQILDDNDIELEIKKQLEKGTRNQIVLINKVLDDLEKVINAAKKNIE